MEALDRQIDNTITENDNEEFHVSRLIGVDDGAAGYCAGGTLTVTLQDQAQGLDADWEANMVNRIGWWVYGLLSGFVPSLEAATEPQSRRFPCTRSRPVGGLTREPTSIASGRWR